MSEQPEALRLANMIERYNAGVMSQAICENYQEAAAELRRLHAVNQELLEALDEIAINTHDDTAERVARAAIEESLKERNT